MTERESQLLITWLVAQYPGSRFTPENAKAYERAILLLDAKQAQAALEALRDESGHIPSIAAIKAEVTRQKRERVRVEEMQRLRITDGKGGNAGPAPFVWGASLTHMLADSARHQAMAAKFYASHGKPTPPDPGQKFLDIAAAGARGQDVSEMAKREGWGT